MQNKNLRLDAGSGTSEFTNTQLNLLMKRKNPQLLHFTLRRMMNARCNYDGKTQFRVSLHHLANRSVLNGENWDLHMESRLDPQVSEIQTLQHSGKEPSNGPCTCKEKQGHQLGGLDQKVTASPRWNPVVDGLGLMRQQQHLEVLWQRRSRRGGGAAPARRPLSSASSVCDTADKWESRRSCTARGTLFTSDGGMATAVRVK